ncbi:hypothetical protein B0T19DRAFT_11174 [Cercophora scortea]|uniref:Secreted protein n=1 Tax=Cercophora scortea TaxID=314031 RepID=A0AAE0J2Y9_9PEZI|nr:hypothetical protein B0T19DRAFT_11174 [Cercophora scortea]
MMLTVTRALRMLVRLCFVVSRATKVCECAKQGPLNRCVGAQRGRRLSERSNAVWQRRRGKKRQPDRIIHVTRNGLKFTAGHSPQGP